MTTLADPHRAAPPGPSRRRRWLVVGTVGWALLLLAGVAISYHRDAPTVREQRDIAQAAPVVDRAAAEISRAVAPEAVAVLAPPTVTPGCRITSARDGAQLDREVTVHAAAGDAAAVLHRLGQRLPAGYAVRLRTGADGRPDALRADAGEFVGVRGTIMSPGVVRLVVTTGCRPQSRYDVADPLIGHPADEVPPRVLAAAGAAAESSTGTSVRCPGGGVVRTATAEGRPATMPARLGEAAAPPAGATVLVDEPDRLAYRDGDAVAVVVQKVDDRVRASATSTC